jgi:hypothetical protein
MPELSFKEWVEKKVEEDLLSEQGQRRTEWCRAYAGLKDQICRWLREDGDGKIRINSEWIERREEGLGAYTIEALRVDIGASSVNVVPVSRNVIAHINPPGGGEFRGEGRVDITDGARKYYLYRTIQDGTDVWYVVDERRHEVTPLTRERFQEIVIDLMS